MLDKIVVGSMILNELSANKICSELCETDFVKYRKEFNIIKAMVADNEFIDVNILAEKGLDIKVLGECVAAVPIAHNIEMYIEKIKERTYIDNARLLINKLSKLVENRDFDSLVNAWSEIPTYNKLQEKIRSTKELIQANINDMYHRKTLKDGILGLRTGFYELDELTGGIKEGELVIIEAPTNKGKSILAMNIACNIAKQGLRSDFFGYEMRSELISSRLLSSVIGIDSQVYQRPEKNLTIDVDRQIKAYKDDSIIKNINIFGQELFTSKTFEEVKSFIALTNNQFKNEPSIIVIDYPRLMRGKGEHKWEQERDNYEKMMNYVGKTKYRIIAIKTQDKQGNTKGSTDDLYDVHQHYKIDIKDGETRGTIIVEKNRSGRTGMVPIQLDLSKLKFVNPER